MKNELSAELRRALRETLALRAKGSTFPKLSFSQGYADGYMRALLDAKLATTKELLAIVAEERNAASGPALEFDGELRDSAPESGVRRRLSRAVA